MDKKILINNVKAVIKGYENNPHCNTWALANMIRNICFEAMNDIEERASDKWHEEQDKLTNEPDPSRIMDYLSKVRR